MTDSSDSTQVASPTPRRRWGPILIALVIVVAAAGGGLWWFFRGDAPAKVNLDTATSGVTTVPGEKATSLPGIWKVDTKSGSFDYSKATGTFAGFRVSEELANVGSTTAVGRTGSVSGSLRIEGSMVTEADFTVDLTSITTDRPQRNSRVQQALETDRFPDATFKLSKPIALPEHAASGGSIEVDAKGVLTIHGVDKDVTVPLKAKLVGHTIVVVGAVDVTFSDFGVTAPSSPIVLSVADHGTMEFQLLFTKN